MSQKREKVRESKQRGIFVAVGDRVRDLDHPAFGVGTVVEVNETEGYQRSVVRFDSGRQRTYMSQHLSLEKLRP
jgi:hypothetical protein